MMFDTSLSDGQTFLYVHLSVAADTHTYVRTRMCIHVVHVRMCIHVACTYVSIELCYLQTPGLKDGSTDMNTLSECKVAFMYYMKGIFLAFQIRLHYHNVIRSCGLVISCQNKC